MKLFLAGDVPWRDVGLYDETIKKENPYILESFFYVDDDTPRLMPYYGDFLLDSGAFTFMHDYKGEVNWDEYVDRYIEFINKNKVEKFFELDIDNVIGYDKVLSYRRMIERKTGRQSIPVWHISRGLDEFYKMCDEYPYVALGGIVSEQRHGTKYRKYHASFPWFISEAHKRGAKIHGLGFTALDLLTKCHFDSVDSTAWTTGNRFGLVYWFDGKTMRKKKAPAGKRLKEYKQAALVNYQEWIKFQKYAKSHL